MGTTETFLKLRSSGTPKTGEWNINYDKALSLAKQEGKFIVTCWSNGDACGFCVATEKCMMESAFKDWQKKSGAYFVFQYSGDKDKGKTLKDWIYKKTGNKMYPGFRITIYDAKGNIAYDVPIEGNTLRNSKTGAAGAKAMVENLNAIFAKKPDVTPIPTPTPTPVKEEYKVRFNEKITTKQVNKILDEIDKNGGYCPCQAKSASTKCHCSDFLNNKKIGEPCIRKIYVKMKK